MNDSQLTSDQADLADLEAFIAAQIAGWDETAAHGLETYLRSNPGHTARHWKGKSISSPVPAKAGERAWDKLDAKDVRAAATETTAHLLPRNIRQPLPTIPALSGTRWRENIACVSLATCDSA